MGRKGLGVSEWDDGFAMYCGQEWKTDDDHTHECRRSPGHSIIDSTHVELGTIRVDHWCYCGSKTYPQPTSEYVKGIYGEHDAPGT